MLFPTGDAYMLAVQNSRTAFQDADLKACTVEVTPLGLPKPYSGGFATTFRFSANGGANAPATQWAVRCFKQDLPDLPRRYAAMRRLWSGPADPLFVRAEYLTQGIRVGPGWYPVVKMDWVQGELLSRFVLSRLYNPAALLALGEEVRLLAARLEKLGVAHGDLQHGNIIIQQGRPRLIDYDGVYLPELAGARVAEIGHVNYQHPGRTNQHYSPYLDRFAAIILYLSLQGLSKAPSLWRKYDNGDNFLFRQVDFLEPDASPLLADLAGIAGLASWVERFRSICRNDFYAIPTLEVFLQGGYVAAKPAAHPPKPGAHPPTTSTARHQYPVVDATSLGALSEYVGSRIEVIGRISEYYTGRTNTGAPYLFLNFGEYPKRTLTVVAWSRVLQDLQEQGVEPLAYVGKSVRVTGVVTMYEGRAQMELESASQIRVIVSDARSTNDLLDHGADDWDRSPGRPANGKAAQVFNTLYRDWQETVSGQVEPLRVPQAGPTPVGPPMAQPVSGKSQRSARPAASSASPKPSMGSPKPQAATRPSTPLPHASSANAHAPVAAPPTATIARPRKQQETTESDCFVATVAFGGPDAPEVLTLRRYRDDVLIRSWAGRLCISSYYRHGPALARFVQQHPQLKRLTANSLARLAAAVQQRWFPE